MGEYVIMEKAYKVIPHWANDYPYRDGKCDPVYAETASKARYQAYRNLDIEDDEWIKYRVLRWKEKDLFPPKLHPMVKNISKSELQKIIHTYAADSYDPGYRNYYNGSIENTELCNLVEKGIMIRNDSRDSMLSKGSTYFHLTELGTKIAMSTREVLRENLS